VAGQPVGDPLAHLSLAALMAVWAQLGGAQKAACAAYRGVGVDDLEGLFEIAHGGLRERRSTHRT
jgi:hypothetical protein